MKDCKISSTTRAVWEDEGVERNEKGFGFGQESFEGVRRLGSSW